MSSSAVYAGIDVACAVGKRLPICFVAANHHLMPLNIPSHLATAMPRGLGNKEITSAVPYREAARAGRPCVGASSCRKFNLNAASQTEARCRLAYHARTAPRAGA